ncbi:esterase [bacterium]|nr:MAG: esterase [bacterium]
MGALLALIVATNGGFNMASAPVQQQARLVSPEVREDRTIVFRYRSPNAQKVVVNLEGQSALPMTKDANGVWSATSRAAAPDIYGYSFNVDGQENFDPLNPEIKVNLLYVSNMVTVPGRPAENWEVQDVPHGELHRHFYKSGVIGDQRDYFVYTPPGYRSGKKKLPVLYLLHGFSDTAEAWTTVGKGHVIMDNLIAQGKAQPMVVVMTLGYGVPDFVNPKRPRDRAMSVDNVTKYRDALMGEVIPAVEKEYRVSPRREDRAIAGLSMGGGESLFTGLSRLDRFAYIGAFSSAGLPTDKPEDALPKLDPATVKSTKLVWMACGTEDGLISFQRGFSEWLKKNGFPIVTKETPGGHTWLLWRRYLAEYAGMLFRP